METGAKRILIVDDEAFIRVLLFQTLEELSDVGVEVLTATNGEEAIGLALRYHPQLIFLDVMMPRMDGFEVCRQLKQQEGYNPHIIFLTAKGDSVDRQSASAVGGDEYITKPFDPEYILERAESVLEL